MAEKELPFNGIKIQEFGEKTPHPNLLDIAKIDGRWTQIIGSGNCIRYLDDKSEVEINWDEFQFIKDWIGLPIKAVKQSTNFTPEELGRVHWGSEQEKIPLLREVVSVFGEFEKKPE